MDNASLGVAFANTLPEALLHSRRYSLNGSGVALGDFDGDGKLDVYLCNKGGRNALYRNLGGWRFEDVTDRMGVGCGGQASTGALFGDLNGDGWLDLLVTGFGGPNAVFLNLAGKGFTNITIAAGLLGRGNMTSMAMADWDGDGLLDLYVANFGLESIGGDHIQVSTKVVNGETLVLGRHARRAKIIDGKLTEFGEPDWAMHNLGGGRFSPLKWEDAFNAWSGEKLAVPWDFGLAVQMRDFNGDGLPDIYVCNDFQTPDRLWLNTGDGRFKAAPASAFRTLCFASMGVDAADINRDGLMDIMTVEMMPRGHRRQMEQQPNFLQGNRRPGDDVEVEQVARNCLYLNRGDGTYAEIAQLAGVEASDWSWTVMFLDVDLDGYEDILISNGNLRDMNNLDIANLPTGPQPLSIPKVAFRNLHNLRFEEAAARWGLAATNITQGMAAGDLDGDGDMDLVMNSLNGEPLFFRNDSSAPRLAVRLRGLSPNSNGVGATIFVKGAGMVQQQEIICGGHYLSGSEMMRTFAAFGPDQKLDVEVRWRSGRVTEWKGVEANSLCAISESGSLSASVAAPSPAQPLLQRWTDAPERRHEPPNMRDFEIQPSLPRQISASGPAMLAPEWTSAAGRELWNSSGQDGELRLDRFEGAQWKSVDIGQLAKGGGGTIVGLGAWQSMEKRLMGRLEAAEEGGGRWVWGEWQNRPLAEVQTLPLPDTHPSCVVVGDVSGGAGWWALVGGGAKTGRWPEPSRSALLRWTGTTWVLDGNASAVLGDLGLVSSAVFVDLNGDGTRELVVVGEWARPMVFQFSAGAWIQTTPQWGLGSLSGWWTSIISADLNEDGRPDLVLGNWGRNTPWESGSTGGLEWYFGEVSDAPGILVVETTRDVIGGPLLPRRNLNHLAKGWPGLKEMFSSHAEFASLNLDQIFDRARVRLKIVRADVLDSLVLLNRGSYFEAVPLPIEAQFSPVMALASGDIDGDGHSDLVLAQNFFQMRPDASRCDAGRGLVLLGNGKGGWKPLSSVESGMLIDGEQRSVSISDFDGDGRADVVVGRYGAKLSLWKASPGK